MMSQKRKSLSRSRRVPKSRRLKSPYALTFEALEPRQMLSVTSGSSWPNFDQAAVRTAGELAQESLVRDYLNDQADMAYLQEASEGAGLRLIEVKHGLASTTTRFQQTLDGIPVYGAFVTVNQGPKGEFQQVFDQGFENLETVEQIGAQISIDMAETFAMAELGATESFAESRGERVWLVSEDGSTAKQVWQVTVYAHDVHGDWLTLVSAIDGQVEMQENRMAYATGSGLVYAPNPYQENGGGGAGILDAGDATNATLDALRQT